MASLFEEFRLKDVVLRNRVAVAPMCQYSSENGFPNDWHFVHLGSRAVGGAGMVMVEATAVTAEGRISPADSGIYLDDHVQPFAKIAHLLPATAKVASTDFVHPRYTHFERSYDYSDYVRRVAGGTTEVPPDTEYIVIDTQGPYSRVHGPEDVRELHEERVLWELLPDQTNGYFLVLKRKESVGSTK